MNTSGKKYGGRKSGTPNKNTQELRTSISNFLSKNWKSVQKDFDTLDAKDKLIFIEKILKYSLPTLQATTLTTNFETLSDDQLSNVIEGLIKASKNG